MSVGARLPPMVATRPIADWLSRKQAANYLSSLGYPITANNLAKLATHGNRGNGPPFQKFRNTHVRYARADLDAWAQREACRVA